MPVNMDSETNTLDIFLGKKLKDYRQKLGWTLAEMAEKIGVSHQQIHKYEQGLTKISATLLFKLSQMFSVSPNCFFEGFDPTSLAINREGLISMKKKEIINILMIEDNPADEFLARRALENSGHKFNIYCLKDRDEVFNFLRRQLDISPFSRPDIILLDLNLPKVSGHSILKALKQDRELQDIPVIVLTSSLNRTDMINSYKNHASGFIIKSFDYEVFEKNLQTAINYWIDAVVLPNEVAA
jgi:CheY-like chemotaxis protein